MGKNLRKDFIMLALIAGSVAAAVRTVVSAVPFALGVTKNIAPVVLAEIILQMKEMPLKFSYLLLGEFAHVLFGGILAVGLGLVYVKWGTDFYLIKGAVYGLSSWLICKVILCPLIIPGPPEPLNLATAVVSLTSHVIYGLLAGYIIVKYGDLFGDSAGKTKA
ncbi:MAG: hypothetical protein C4570_07760 [Ammonifex sp.]|nr:MAG: hypothetical protein C4570_07760 [Ammonifex sp.]